MELRSTSHPLELPAGTRSKLRELQRRVWRLKLFEGFLRVFFGLAVSYLAVLGLDRLGETPSWLRGTILIAGSSVLAVWLPLHCRRWIWRTRKWEQVARLLRHRSPRLSDQLLGVIELVRNPQEQQRSEALCRAALAQVDGEVARHDLSHAVPATRHRRWTAFAAMPLALIVTAVALAPEASQNALWRWLLPWGNVERFTFARLEPLPAEIVVPAAEPFDVVLTLAPDTLWSPDVATASYADQSELTADKKSGRYSFMVPPQNRAGLLELAVGDARAAIRVLPTARPELTQIVAQVLLPDYLQRPGEHPRDLRGGSVSIVEGSEVHFVATASRELAFATMNGLRQNVSGAQISTRPVPVLAPSRHELSWRDRFGLEARAPFAFEVRSTEDEAPTLIVNELASETVLLVDDVLSFEVEVHDDFGVREVGLEWAGVEDRFDNPEPAHGEKIIAAGRPDLERVVASATFSAGSDGVPPQTLKLRLSAIDYHPERGRVTSRPFTVVVLSAEDHAIWLTRQLNEWQRRNLEVYEREQQLYQTNRELRALPADAIDRPENRRRIETQARAEATNARRLEALTRAGEELVREATRNDQFNATNLEDLARVLQALADLAENRMPSVADLLKQSAASPGSLAQASPRPVDPKASEAGETPPSVSSDRDSKSASSSGAAEPSPIPGLGDTESSLGGKEEDEPSESTPKESPPGRLTLPSTTLAGTAPPSKDSEPPAPKDPLDRALEEQEKLLAEFARVSDELRRILGELEGSTFVKRFKAASRMQIEVARDVNRNLLSSFGIPKEEREEESWPPLLADREVRESGKVALIQEDLEAYFNRTQEGKFETVLREMIDVGVVNGLHTLSADVEEGLDGQTIARAEYWADALDRWAEQLVGPG